jgi:hypothetical protein
MPGGGGPRNPPGRGHPHQPRPWGPSSAALSSPSTTPDPVTQVTPMHSMQSMFQQLLAMGQEQRTDTNSLARLMREEHTTQAQINADLQSNLAQLSADLAALRQNTRK